jgi:CheY-like chemotaxis protein
LVRFGNGPRFSRRDSNRLRALAPSLACLLIAAAREEERQLPRGVGALLVRPDGDVEYACSSGRAWLTRPGFRATVQGVAREADRVAAPLHPFPLDLAACQILAVEGLGHRVLGVARTHSEAVALVRAKRPGVILADIQLADGSSGLDAVNEMLRSFEVPVIFITAYPERFLTGERPEPAFLIAKPFQPATVSTVLSQALFFERNAKRRERRAS